MIKTVIFDIGNVLTDFRWEAFLRDKGYSEEMVERLGKATVKSGDWGEYDRGVLTDEEVMERFVKHDPEIEKEIREALADSRGIVTKRDYAIPWIKELKARGLQVLVLSNFPYKASVECADALDFLEYVDGGILSYKDKVIKPDLSIYLLLMHRYQFKPEECVFLDDSKRNIEAANSLGWHAIWFQNKEDAQIKLNELLK